MRVNPCFLLIVLLMPVCGPAGLQAGQDSDAVDRRLQITGAQQVSEQTLRRAFKDPLTALYEQGFPKSKVDDIAFEIERYYRARGHYFVRVDYTYTPANATLTISEGPRVLLGRLRFSGNTVITGKELAALAPPTGSGFLGLSDPVYVKSYGSSLAAAVEKAYRRRGYLEMRISDSRVRFSSDRTRANIELVISEGRQYILMDVSVRNAPFFGPERLAERFKGLVGLAYGPTLRLEVKTGAEDFYADEGYPEAVANVHALATETESQVRMTLELEVRPGPQVIIGDVAIRGNDRVNEAFIRNRLLTESDEIYREQAIRRSYGRLFQTGLFSSVKIGLAEEDRPADPNGARLLLDDIRTRDLNVEVKERSSREHFYEIGFGSYDLLRGRTGLRERNLFGRGLIGSAEVGGSVRGQQIKFSLSDPWFLQTQWRADLPLSFLTREEPSFTLRESKIGIRLSKPLTERVTIGSTYRFSLSHIQNLSAASPFKEETNLNLGAAGPFVQYDSRNDFLAPTRGSQARAFVELGGSALGGEISFVHVGVSASRYFELREGTVLCGRAATRWIRPILDTENIPIQERLFNGGENTVRSFRQSELGPRDVDGDPLGGEVRNLLTVELRQRIAGQFSAALFADYGNVGLTVSDAFHDFSTALGFGLRYALPIGPIRLDTGFNPNQQPGEDEFVIHFAVGMPF